MTGAIDRCHFLYSDVIDDFGRRTFLARGAACGFGRELRIGRELGKL